MDYGGVVFIDEVAIGGIQKLDNRLDELILTGKANLALISFSRCGILNCFVESEWTARDHPQK